MIAECLPLLECPVCATDGKAKVKLTIQKNQFCCSSNHAFAILNGIAMFSQKKDGLFEDSQFVNCYVESHYRDLITPSVEKNANAKKEDHTDFYSLPLHENYYEDAVALLLEDCPKPFSALDLGCSVGRCSVALARSASVVVGVDPSLLQIQTANEILKTKNISVYVGQSKASYPGSEGVRISVPFDAPENVEFLVADDRTLPFREGAFDVICCSAVIDCTEDPEHFIQTLARLTHTGSRVFVSTPFEWLEKDTPKKNWLGSGAYGTVKGKPEAALAELMARHGFRLLREKNLRWATTVHSRKYIVWSVYAGVFERL